MNKIDQLKETAETIKTNELPQSNTALLVGKHLEMVNEVLESILTDLNNKVSSENGKGLSTNDFTNAYKTALDKLNTELSKYVQKETGKGLSTNDYTNEDKNKLSALEQKVGWLKIDTPKLIVGYVRGENGTLSTSTTVNKYTDKINVDGMCSVRFEGSQYTSSSTAASGYAFYDSSDNFVGGAVYDKEGTEGIKKEYNVDVPEGAKYLRITVLNNYADTFYCYLNPKDSLQAKKADKAELKILSEFLNKIDIALGKKIDIDNFNKIQFAYLTASATWTGDGNSNGVFIPVEGGQRLYIKAPKDYAAFYGYMKDEEARYGQKPNFVEGYEGRFSISPEKDEIIEIPKGCTYINIACIYNKTAIHTPDDVRLLNTGSVKQLQEIVGENFIDISTNDYSALSRYISASTNAWVKTTYKCKLIPIVSDAWYHFFNPKAYIRYAFLKSNNWSEGEMPEYADGYDNVVTTNRPVLIKSPHDAAYLYLYYGSTGNYVPDTITNMSSVKYLKKLYDTNFGDGIIELNDRAFTKNVLAQLNRGHGTAERGTTGYIKQYTLLHFSDIHGSADELARIADYYNEYKKYIGNVLCTGDMQSTNFNESFSFWNDNAPSNFMGCIGNHDAANTNSGAEDSGWITAENCYAKYFANTINEWGVSFEEGKCYYYKDDAESKVRLIVLDEYHYNNTQETWLVNTLNSALELEYHVLMAVHSSNGSLSEFACTFALNKKGSSQGTNPNISAKQKVQDFIDAGGNLICWLCGHGHYDNCGFSDDYPEQFRVMVACARQSSSPDNYNVERIKGTISQDCFNIVSVDTANGYLRVFRVGANYDRFLRHQGSFCLDYKNRKLISNN